ncbi:hypothetical protein PAEH1_01365 [Paenalcaligenes hominis]|uniref:Peptidase S24/S26A/S26B/S26C domain-containing protein n=1 Tax=Paenalcaligenes hominis TaxID=643674 RepID=A0A1U9JXL2_9BURK|nr:S24 family peptidase [Paenalcaligenes hominis]AQS50530.1 hypothetical protein PAEH1_01365 [Paenalcaligenes hominis]
MVDYSERLSLAMDRVGVDVRQLSDALDATYQAVKKVVDGKSNAFNAANNARAAQFLNVNSDWLALGMGPMDRERGEAMLPAISSEPPEGYTRLEHLPYQPSMGAGRAHDGDLVVQHLDVLDSFIKQKVGSTNSSRIKLLTGIGQSMMPAIQDHDIVFVDIEHKWIDVPGYYVIDVGGLLLLKKAMILSNGTLVLKSENTEEFPDEERYDLATAADSITVCGKVLAWWTLRKG